MIGGHYQLDSGPSGVCFIVRCDVMGGTRIGGWPHLQEGLSLSAFG